MILLVDRNRRPKRKNQDFITKVRKAKHEKKSQDFITKSRKTKVRNRKYSIFRNFVFRDFVIEIYS
jgi:hypothetical protein